MSDAAKPALAAQFRKLEEAYRPDALQQQGRRDRAGLRSAMERLLFDRPLRKTLIDAGFRRLGAFSWKTAGRETLSVIEGCMQ